ncbi:MAG: hypothetical protein KJ645_01970, partial [Planctomycetes bacterium]|nr:hypothetical protein [Planctomycetota bacterium]
WSRGSDGKLYKNKTDSGELDPGTDRASSGPFNGTVDFKIQRDDEGENSTYFIKATDWSGDKVYAQTSDIVIPGIQRSWTLENVTRLKGPDHFRDEDKSWKFVKEFKCAVEDAGIRLECREEDNREHFQQWVNSIYQVGPLPKVLLKGKKTGFWIQETTTKASLDDSFLSPTWTKLFFFYAEKNERESEPSWNEEVHLGKVTPVKLEKAQKLGLAGPSFLSGENAEGRADLVVIDGDLYDRGDEEIRFRIQAAVETLKEKVVFELVYRQDKPLESGDSTSGGVSLEGSSLSSNLPGSGSAQTAQAGGGRPGNGNEGAIQEAGPVRSANPWAASMEQARTWNAGENPAAASPADSAELTYEQILASATPWAFPQVQAVMDEWISLAKPPINDGLPWHYTEWGVLENGINVKAVRPDNQGKSRHQYLWEYCRRLTSVRHLTLGEYIRLRLTGGALETDGGREKEKDKDRNKEKEQTLFKKKRR